MNVLGSGKDYFAQVSALTEDVGRVRLELRASEQSRDSLKRELAGEEPILLADPTPVEPPVSVSPELATRLADSRRRLDDLLGRFTDEHPDVVATRRLIAELEEQRNKELEARRRTTSPSKGLSAATNPVFQKIKIALAEAEANVAALRGRLAELEGRLAHLRAAAGRVPQVEAEFAQLNRDYDVLRKKYDELVARRESASISEDVDATTQLANFRIIDPPRVSPKPVFPNRASLAPLALVVALGLGVFTSFALAQLFPTIDSARTLREIAQRPVLGIVSMRSSPVATRRRRVSNIAFGGVLSTLIIVFGAWIAWIGVLSAA
jgi:polysaccharide chain length determinant protein (PEP-CTERM system associated)